MTEQDGRGITRMKPAPVSQPVVSFDNEILGVLGEPPWEEAGEESVKGDADGSPGSFLTFSELSHLSPLHYLPWGAGVQEPIMVLLQDTFSG